MRAKPIESTKARTLPLKVCHFKFNVYPFPCGSAAAVGGSVYAMGGYDGSQRLDLVEKYDPATDQWSTVTCMGVRRDGLAASTPLACA